MPLPERAIRELDAMDAAVRGESVDPEFAEVAELALMLAGTRPEPSEDVAYRLDLRVSALASEPARRPWDRFASAFRSTSGAGQRRPLMLRPAFGAGLAAVVAIVVVVVLVGRGGSSSRSTFEPEGRPVTAASAPAVAAATSTSPASSAAAAGSSSSSASGSSSGSPSRSGSTGGAGLAVLSPTKHGPANQSAQSPAASSAALSKSLDSLTPTPQSNGRKIIQSSQLTLTTPGSRVATVSQELFNVVGAEQGIVKHSQVNSGAGASANFTLSIPASNLAVTLARLDQLRYATVASSTSSTSDVNSQYLDNQRALADAKALRSSLLTQLESATTTAAVDSIKAQIKDAESTIASDEGKVNTLNGQIAYSSVTVQIDSGSVPVTPSTGQHSGFTLSRAAHDALKVLTAVGGGTLIALAVIVPLGLVVGLIAWGSVGWRRRRREHALDAA